MFLPTGSQPISNLNIFFRWLAELTSSIVAISSLHPFRIEKKALFQGRIVEKFPL
jgi:hypothetical protein